LDFEAVRLVQQILPSLTAKGKTIIISSHIPESLTTICKSISLISNGEIEFKTNQSQFDRLKEMIDFHSGFESVDLI
jgi:ABC-2 type transport system ATP-binding protein